MRKRLLYILGIILITGFFSCLNTEETIQVNADNSGTYSLNIDMGQLLKMARQMNPTQQDSLPEKTDSTISFKNFIDTARNLSKEEKDLFRNGTMRLQIDKERDEMGILLSVPFRNIQQVSKIRSSMGEIMKKMDLKGKLANNKERDSINPATSAIPDMDNNPAIAPTARAYTFSSKPGKIANTFTDKTAFDKIRSDSSLQMMQTFSAMMGDMNYSTKIILPKPIKNYKGNNVEISPDRKTIKLSTTLSDILNRPEALAYEVEY